MSKPEADDETTTKPNTPRNVNESILASAHLIPEGPLSVDVQYKALPSHPVHKSPSPEGTIGAAILPPHYAPEQHETWNRLYDAQQELLEGKVCSEYITGRALLDISRTTVPRLADVSASLFAHSGWQLVRVDGYVPENIFFKILASKCFPCTDFVRHPSELAYTPAPDMFHDIVGHLPLFTNPRFASFFHAYGLAGTHAKNEEEVAWLGRIYWYTVEFGLLNPTAHAGAARREDRCSIYGSGIASSVGEIPHSLSSKVKKKPFHVEAVAQTLFDIHHMQERYFEIASFDELESEFRRWASAKGLLPA